MRTAIYFFYGLDVEIRPKMDPPSCLSTWVGCYVYVILHIPRSAEEYRDAVAHAQIPAEDAALDENEL